MLIHEPTALAGGKPSQMHSAERIAHDFLKITVEDLRLFIAAGFGPKPSYRRGLLEFSSKAVDGWLRQEWRRGEELTLGTMQRLAIAQPA